MPIKSIRSEFLISYDIEENKKRTKLFQILRNYGLFPIQKSVFWGFLTKAEYNAIARHVKDSLGSSDKCLITPIAINYLGKYTTCVGYQKNDFKDWREYGGL